MWIFMSDSFLSVVADRNNPKNLLVRARAAGDIERVFPKAVVSHTPSADYAYRASVSRGAVASKMAHMIEAVDYPNFKDSVAEDDRHHAYFRAWSAMMQFQTERLYPRRVPGDFMDPLFDDEVL